MSASHAGSRRAALVAAAALLLVALAAVPAVRAADDDHPGHDGGAPAAAGPAGGRVGVLLADHGEPPEYNRFTYESFREFFGHLIEMGVIPSWLTALETGTILYDADCAACESPSEAPRLIDAWLRPHDGPAVFVPASESLPAHYVLPGGPGFREPDIYEHVGLQAWHEWQRMGGRSPNYDEKLVKKHAVIERLRAAYGDRVPIRVGYGIDPRIGGARQGIREALDALVNRDRITSLVVVYHGVGFSDIMQTHHLRHLVERHLKSLGAGDVAVRYAAPLGTTGAYVRAIVEKVRSELALLPRDAAVAIHLSGHGLATTTCGEYDCGADAYHRYAADLFARVAPAVEAAVAGRPGRTGVFHIYGDGSEGDADPEDRVDSPIEALDARAAEGWSHVVDIPYEFDSNSRDTLIVLRQSYRRPQPDWNAAWESHFAYRGVDVKIANVNGGEALKIDALHEVATDVLGPPDPPTATRTPAARPTDGSHIQVDAVDHHERGSPASTSERPQVEVDAVDHHERGSPASTSERFPHDDDEHGSAAAPIAASHHGASRPGGGAATSTGIVLVVGGVGAVAAAVALRRRLVPGRIALAGVGTQLAGLGWDVWLHARGGVAVDLLENNGHRLAFVGLAATAVAAAVLLRGDGPPLLVTGSRRDADSR